MKINYDKIADAVYIKIRDTKVKKTKEISDQVIADLDSKGNIVGIEILDASSQQNLVKSLEKNAKDGVPIEITSVSLLPA